MCIFDGRDIWLSNSRGWSHLVVPVTVLKGWSVNNTSWRSLYTIPTTTDTKKVKDKIKLQLDNIKSKSPFRMSESNRSCKPTNKLVCNCRCISKLQKLERNKRLWFVVAHRRFKYKPLILKILEETFRLACSSCFPR